MIRNSRDSANEQKSGSPLYLLTGLALGFILGLLISWLAFPARANGISPAQLAPLDKEQYRTQIAMAYAASGDAQRAAARLSLLEDRDPIRALNVQAQLALLDQDSQREARALSQLSQAIYDLVLARLADESDTEIILLDKSAYSITEQQTICEDAASSPMLKLFMLDGEGQAFSGLRLLLTSAASEEESFTGLRPELGAGYTEFDLFPNEQYTLAIQDIESIAGIEAPICSQEDGEDYWGTLLLTLRAQ